MMEALSLDYRVNFALDQSDGNGHAMFYPALLSGNRYWHTEYEESNYRIIGYDVNLIFQ